MFQFQEIMLAMRDPARSSMFWLHNHHIPNNDCKLEGDIG